MGLYDSVYIEYPLPIAGYIPEQWKSLARLEFTASGFQTKDLERCLDTYFIDNYGNLFLDHSRWEDQEDIKVKVNHHGYIYVYTVIDISEEKNLFIEYKLKYTDGKLVEAEMTRPKKEEIDEIRLHSSI